MFQAKISNIFWLQLLKCENLLLFVVIKDNKLTVFDFELQVGP